MNLRIGIAVLAVAGSLSAQIAYDSTPDLLKLPEHIYLGEAAGVATNSKGNIFVYTRTGGANKSAKSEPVSVEKLLSPWFGLGTYGRIAFAGADQARSGICA
jgi:hypothetical protein